MQMITGLLTDYQREFSVSKKVTVEAGQSFERIEGFTILKKYWNQPYTCYR